MNKEEIAESLRKSVSDLLNSKGVNIVDIELKPSRERSMLVRFLVDKPQGITLNECAELNRLIGDIIDKENIIAQSCVLEVSSPGLDRPLKTKEDFERVKGKIIDVIIKVEPRGTKKITGKLIVVEDDKIILNIDGQTQNILLSDVRKAILNIDIKKVS